MKFIDIEVLPKKVYQNPFLYLHMVPQKIFGCLVFTDQTYPTMHYCRGLLFLLFLVLCNISQFTELFKNSCTFDGIINNITMAFIAFMFNFRLAGMYINRSGFLKLIKEVYANTTALWNDGNVAELDILNKYNRYVRILTIIYTALGSSCWILLSVTPLVQWFGIDPSTKAFMIDAEANSTLTHNTILPTPPPFLRLWTPFPKWKYFYWTYFVQVTNMALTAIILPSWCAFSMALMTYPVIMMEEIVYKLEHSQEYVDSIIRKMESDEYHLGHPRSIFKCRKQKFSDEIRCNILTNCIRRHVKVNRFVALYQSLMGVIQLLDVVMFSIPLCGVLYQSTKLPCNLELITQLILMSGGLYILFLYYWHANEICYLSGKISSAIYCSNWYVGSLRYKKNIQIFLAATSEPVMLKAGFVSMDLTVFGGILKAAYSYFTLLTQLNAK